LKGRLCAHCRVISTGGRGRLEGKAVRTLMGGSNTPAEATRH